MTWLKKINPDLVVLFLTLVVIELIFKFFGHTLAPVFLAIATAYLLQHIVILLQAIAVPRRLAVIIVYVAFLGVAVVAMLVFFPLLSEQLTRLFLEFPTILQRTQTLWMQLPERYPHYISALQLQHIIAELRSHLASWGQVVLSVSIASIASIITWCVYLILVPLLIYFFLMDQDSILNWIKHYLPKRRRLLGQVWYEVYAQMGNYVRGKVLEVLIVTLVFYLFFVLIDLNFAALLAVLAGLSVIIPYIGVVLVGVPIAVMAFLQWGFTPEFGYFMLISTILALLDANILVPLLFANAVKLHPVAIILAVLVFGGIWGFWGIFFAIPLASLTKALLRACQDGIRQVD